ncbi:hypothetical protein JCM18899A_29940 [Nocardioides sp. AN3]
MTETAPLPVESIDDLSGVIVVEGVVEHGDQRGRMLGFPTANVRDTDQVRLDGVYAGTLQIDPAASGPMHIAAVSVGHRPTYYGKDGLRLLEANLLDFSGDLYGRAVRIELHVRLRPQHRFVDTATLVRQLHLDVEATRWWAWCNGLAHLLEPEPQPRRRRDPQARARQDRRATIRARAAARTDRIIHAVLDAAPGELSHEWVAGRTGLPLGYLVWRFPDVDDLATIAR